MRFKNPNRVKINLIVSSIFIIQSVVICTSNFHNKLLAYSISCTKNIIIFSTNQHVPSSHVDDGSHEICNGCEIEDWTATEKFPRNLWAASSIPTILKLGKHQKYHINYLPRAPPA